MYYAGIQYKQDQNIKNLYSQLDKALLLKPKNGHFLYANIIKGLDQKKAIKLAKKGCELGEHSACSLLKQLK